MLTRVVGRCLHRRVLLSAVLLATVGCIHVGRPAVAKRAAIGPPARLDHAPRASDDQAPLVYWTEAGQGLEPVAIHALRADLRDARLEVVSIIADDPDADGPAEAALTDPRQLAGRAHVAAAVNANGFAGLPDASGKRDERWRADLPVDICGLAAHQGARRSDAQADIISLCFGIDRAGRPFIGPVPGRDQQVAEAVNAWSFDLVGDGSPIPQPGGERHPRTAVGLDAGRRWLYLVVVDGRQPGYSVGMTARELADLMVRLGADRAMNLDGGGSSVLMVAGQGDTLNIVNRPSGREPRPVPVLLAVRVRRNDR